MMHLFAIIAPAQGNESDRRRVVEAFLRPQLNQEGVEAYLRIFDTYYAEAQLRLKKGNEARRNAAISVRIIKICFEIGTQLTLNQKIIVLVQLWPEKRLNHPAPITLIPLCRGNDSKKMHQGIQYLLIHCGVTLAFVYYRS